MLVVSVYYGTINGAITSLTEVAEPVIFPVEMSQLVFLGIKIKAFIRHAKGTCFKQKQGPEQK